MEFDFDAPIERRGTDSVKWGRYAGRDVLPLWVADMDFAAPPAVIEALHRRIGHGVFGYGEPWPSLTEAVTESLQRDYAWRIAPDWVVWLPGLVTGLHVACRAVGETGTAVFTATPIYPPFLTAPGLSGRRAVSAPLRRDGARWTWDWDAVEAALTPDTRLFMLCNPHNPLGRVFDMAELTQVGRLAERRDLVVCSDEIHCGLVLDADKRHVPLASLDPKLARRTITLMAPSKTWNLPGLGSAFAVIPDPGLRRRCLGVMRGIVPHPNVLGLAATEAAYRDPGDWHRELIGYLRANRDLALQEVNAIEPLQATPVEATYLAWIDCRGLGLKDPARFFEAAGLGLSDGKDFGAPGWVRLNFGCRRAVLEEALRRMKLAVQRLGAAGSAPAG